MTKIPLWLVHYSPWTSMYFGIKLSDVLHYVLCTAVCIYCAITLWVLVTGEAKADMKHLHRCLNIRTYRKSWSLLSNNLMSSGDRGRQGRQENACTTCTYVWISKPTEKLFYMAILITLVSNHFAWRKAARCSPLFHTAVSRGPRPLNSMYCS